jgi:RimJ/RimL family protein N-acetyltransferase
MGSNPRHRHRHTGRVIVTLRPQQVEDLVLLTGGESPFDDFGPTAIRTTPRPSRLDADGGLSVITDDGQLAGDVSWHWRQWGPNAGSRCPMIGIWLRPAYRGRGIGSAGQAQLVDLFFRHTTTNRVEAHTDVDNAAERRALETAGFRREGVTRGAQWRDGAYRDGILYAVLRGDPRPAAPPRTMGGLFGKG